MTGVVTGLVCAVCGARESIATPLSWLCPNATLSDRHHVLHFESSVEPFRPTDETNPYLAFRRYLAVDSLGESLGLSDDQRVAIITSADEAVSRVVGTGFLRTPLTRSDELSEALGFSATGGIWVKDEIILPELLADWAQNWLEDNISEEVYTNIQNTADSLQTREQYESKVIELFESYLNNRASSMEEQISKFPE